MALADLTGNGSAGPGGPGDPFLFGDSGGLAINLNVTDANNNSYTFTTDFAEFGGLLNQGWWSRTETNFDANTNYIVANASIYADLGTSNYGSIAVGSDADYRDPLNIALNANAIADLNAVLNTRDYFSIGGTLTPGTAPVPEPVSFVLLGTVAAIFLRQLRRKALA